MVPLEHLEHVTFIKGPRLKRSHVTTLKFETAWPTPTPAHDTQLTGVIDTHRFMNRILERRDELRHGAAKPGVAAMQRESRRS
jgi:hypothetical protein